MTIATTYYSILYNGKEAVQNETHSESLHSIALSVKVSLTYDLIFNSVKHIVQVPHCIALIITNNVRSEDVHFNK